MSANSAQQQLKQQVCQKYGWSVQFFPSTNGDETTITWNVEVIVGPGDKRQFSNTTSIDITADQSSTPSPSPPGAAALRSASSSSKDKELKEAIALIALEGLADVIAIEQAKTTKELRDVFDEPLTIYDSRSPGTWEKFWRDPPKVVGIDTEGNQQSPPVLVQIATEKFIILEVPGPSHGKDNRNEKRNGVHAERLSTNLRRLLQDRSISKVFCDNFSHRDKISLGIEVENSDNFSGPPILDLEVMAFQLLGPVKVPRGLSKLINLIMPPGDGTIRIEKPKKKKGNIKGRFASISRFALIEQGKSKPLRGLFDLSQEEQRYAALDAWCTLKLYHRLQTLATIQSKNETTETTSITADIDIQDKATT